MATGHFSWREPPGPGGTVLAGGPPQGTSPARGPWAKTGMVRARLEGLSFGSPQPSPSAPVRASRQQPAQVSVWTAW